MPEVSLFFGVLVDTVLLYLVLLNVYLVVT